MVRQEAVGTVAGLLVFVVAADSTDGSDDSSWPLGGFAALAATSVVIVGTGGWYLARRPR